MCIEEGALESDLHIKNYGSWVQSADLAEKRIGQKRG